MNTTVSPSPCSDERLRQLLAEREEKREKLEDLAAVWIGRAQTKRAVKRTMKREVMRALQRLAPAIKRDARRDTRGVDPNGPVGRRTFLNASASAVVLKRGNQIVGEMAARFRQVRRSVGRSLMGARREARPSTRRTRRSSSSSSTSGSDPGLGESEPPRPRRDARLAAGRFRLPAFGGQS